MILGLVAREHVRSIGAAAHTGIAVSGKTRKRDSSHDLEQACYLAMPSCHLDEPTSTKLSYHHHKTITPPPASRILPISLAISSTSYLSLSAFARHLATTSELALARAPSEAAAGCRWEGERSVCVWDARVLGASPGSCAPSTRPAARTRATVAVAASTRGSVAVGWRDMFAERDAT